MAIVLQDGKECIAARPCRYTCDHLIKKIKQRINRAGNPYFVYQCETCGSSVGSQIARANIRDIESIPDFDEGLYDAWQKEADERYQSEWERYHTDINREWWKNYNTYLLSPQWTDKRRRTLERDEYLCQACRKREAVQVHHLSYDHVGDEPLFDLISVCQVCHNRLHPDHD